MRFTIFPLFIVLLSCAFSAQAKMYKWVDEDGQMHFGDKIPPKYLVKEHDELNQRGLTVKHKAAAQTAEEKIKKKHLEREQRKAALIAKKKKQRDRVLLDTYTTESDLIVARNSRLEAVDTQIRLAETIVGSSNEKIAALEKQVASIEASNREVPDNLRQRLESEKQQVAVQTRVRDMHKKRRNEIAAQFGDYIKRFKVLKAEQKVKRDKRERERMGQL